MQTLIELYDERPLENVLGAETFRPERVVYICPPEIAGNRRVHRRLRNYFARRGLTTELVFIQAGMYDADGLLELLRGAVRQYPGCALDITGGTDDALFAAGLLSAGTDVPVFTYSRKMNSFYNIRSAPFASELKCGVKFSVEDFFAMAGGDLRRGRVDNGVLEDYMGDIEPFFRLYMANRRQWTKTVSYIQRIAPGSQEGPAPLSVSGGYTLKAERGYVSAPAEALRSMEKIGFIRGLKIVPEKSVSFRFRDAVVRTFLRDVGAVLELYVYKACLDTGLFDDVRLSAVVDWEGDDGRTAVSNELDVVCTRGVIPVFISCKTGEVHTEALNELAVLRDRFGGEMARAAIVTATKGGSPTRSRAHELGIDVIDLNDLTKGRLGKRLTDLIRGVK